jgi:hypothetical protein
MDRQSIRRRTPHRERSLQKVKRPMNKSAVDRAEHPAQWQKVDELPLRCEPGYEEEAIFVLQQALSRLKLPLVLLEKLQTSVYNAFARIGGGQANGEVLLLLFIAARPWALDPTHEVALANEHTQRMVPEPGWGYFLVERRSVPCEESAEARHIVELYCYQEGQ